MKLNQIMGSLAMLSLLSLLSAANGCSDSTGSQRFSFAARIGGTEPPASDGYTFTNERGWTVSLTRANVTLGPVYVNVIPPLRGASARLFDFLIRSAWAQTGGSHLDPGRVVGEVLSQVTFDALSSALVRFPALGTMTQEEVRTADIWFYPEPGVAADSADIDTVALDVAGEAQRDDETVRFRGQLKLNDAWVSDEAAGSRGTQSITGIRQVRGLPATFFPTAGGALEIRFDVKRLFRGADFANLKSNPTDDDGTTILLQGKTTKLATDQVMTNLYQGLHESTGTYSVTWVSQ